MIQSEIEALRLSQGESIEIKIKNYQEPTYGEFIQITNEILEWKTIFGKRRKAV